ncbi:sensor histidine kinase [Paraburkholderia caribensis]|uniref:sensor histidine kinase n=1 Tax=Paraburkholderia caribensis TaxID=75105 RepID=UPI0006D49688|nr:HAMP domain-containing sensor histidine kinase [Paraburkholderia caribensis]ALP66083.1 histidine kinase [Paraburkholderia caribensis]AUT54984.1 histidine kinase [Paraburkholderia caribensis]
MTIALGSSLSRRWHTANLRLLSAYGLIFSITVMMLLAVLCFVVTREMERQNDIVMDWQLTYFDSLPQDQVAEAVQRRLEHERMHAAYYGLFAADGKHIAGDVTRVPRGVPTDRSPVTLDRTLPVGEGVAAPVVRAMANRSSNGDILVVARDLTHIIRIRDDLVNTLLIAGPFCLIVGMAGGLALSFRQVRRLSNIRRVTQAIARGDLNQRLPVGGRDELDMLAHLVNHMLDEVERLMTEVKGACDGIAHDLRTPLAHVRTLLAHIDQHARPCGDPMLLDMLSRARKETDSLLERFRAMLRISEIGALQRRGGFAQVQLEDLVRDVCELYEPLAEARSIELTVQSEPVELIHGDRALLFEALSNLVDNAIKFVLDNGVVSIELKQTPFGPLAAVIDNGPGIPSTERGAIMQRFYRAEQTRHLAGSGLGLSVVCAVMRVHDFRLTIDDCAPGTRAAVECWSHTLA